MVKVKRVTVKITEQKDNGTTMIIKCKHTNINVKYAHTYLRITV